MQVNFTIFNCGTGYNRSNNDVIGQLNKETISEHMITDGAGSGGFTPGWAGGGHNPGGKSTIGGLVGGAGVDANVTEVFNEVKRRHTEMKQNLVINMCGWSRGAVTCFKIANALFKDQATRALPVNIFAIDPVPGGSVLNNHMWKSIENSPNIRMCHVVLSQHDRRDLFAPYVPPVTGPFTDVDIMPGDHSTIVEEKDGKKDASVLVKDLAKRFLRARGVFFKNNALLSHLQILEHYAGIAQNFDVYSKAAAGVSKWSKLRGNYDEIERTIRDVDRNKLAVLRPVYDPGGATSFFINERHRESCLLTYPSLTREFDFPPIKAFARERRDSWMSDFNRMMDDCMEHAKLTMLYIQGCRLGQG